jgi:formate hydrogenlyase subunit 3/multisubunit Na+/H+ antiporter MnhD subunit
MTQDAILLILIPWLAALPALLGKVLGRRSPFAGVSVAIFSVSAIPLYRLSRLVSVRGTEELLYSLGGWPAPVGISLGVDRLALTISVIVVVVVVAVSVFSLGRKHFESLYFAEIMILAGGLQGVLFVRDLFTLFVCFEIAALSIYLLIAYEREATALVASFKYLILSSVGILVFLLGVFVVYRETGTLSMVEPIIVAPEADKALHLAVSALVVGIGVRTAFIPFHTWLPEAHAYAPHPISALLSGVVIKVSFFAMVRVLDTFVAVYLYEPLLWIGGITAIAAVFRALAQRDVKKLLAYHSISQMGYVLAAFGAASVIGREAAIHHAVNHALFKSLLFLTVGYAVSVTGLRDVYKMPKLGRREPLMAIGFWLGALAIAGVPPMNGFFSKADVGAAVTGSPVYPLIWVTGVVTAASFIKLGRIYSFFGPAERGRPVLPTTGEATSSWFSRAVSRLAERIPVLALGSLCLAGGLVLPLPSAAKLASTGVTLAFGVLLFLLISRHRVALLLSPLRRWNPSLYAVLSFFFFGLFLFAVLGYLR